MPPIIGVGGGASAVAAMKKGEIDAISHLDPVIAKLEADGDIQVLIDTRTEAGTRALFGGSNPAAVLYTKQDFIEKNPNTTQRLVNAFMKALKWIADRHAGADRRLRCRPNTISATRRSISRRWQNSKESYSRDGVVQPGGHGERRSTC